MPEYEGMLFYHIRHRLQVSINSHRLMRVEDNDFQNKSIVFLEIQKRK